MTCHDFIVETLVLVQISLHMFRGTNRSTLGVGADKNSVWCRHLSMEVWWARLEAVFEACAALSLLFQES